MSLLRVRRERREWGSGRPKGPPPLWKLLATLALVIIAFWYLSRLG